MIREILTKLFPGFKVPKEGDKKKPRRIGVHGLSRIHRDHPALALQTIWAKQSISSAYGYTYISNQAVWDLLDEMIDRNKAIKACVKQLESILVSRDRSLVFSGDDADDPRADEIRMFVEKQLRRHSKLINKMILGLVSHGVVFLEIGWQEEGGFLVPGWIDSCHPGLFSVSDDGEFMLYEGLELTPIPAGRIMSASLPAPYNSPFGESPLWCLRWEFVLHKTVEKAQIFGAEVNGQPIVHGSVPQESTQPGEYRDELLAQLESLAQNGIIVTAQGEEIKVHQRQGGQGAAEVYDSPLNRLETAIRTVLLGSELAMAAGPNGSRAATQVHDAVMLRSVSPYGPPIIEAINQFLIQPLVRINYGMDAPCPELFIDFEIAADSAEVRASLETAAKIGVSFSAREAREKLGLREPVPGEELVNGPGNSPGGPSGLNPFSRFAVDPGEVYDRYHATVNMTASELSKWAATDCSKKASASRDPIRRNLRLLKKAKSDWTAQDATAANRTISFVSRMRGAMGDPENTVSEECPFTKAEISLANWAWASSRIKRTMKFSGGSGPSNFANKPTSASMKRLAVNQGMRADRQKQKITDALIKESTIQLNRVVRDTLDRLSRFSDRPMTRDDLREVDISRLEPQGSFRNLVAASMIMTAGERMELKRARFPENSRFHSRESGLEKFAAGDEIGSEFADAVAWMASRDIMTREQLDEAADAFAREWGISPEQARSYLRERTLALAGAADSGVTLQVQNLMTHAINQGSTLAEFITAMEAVLETDSLPGNLGAYWENVFRTEMANAYAEQQRRIESDPDLDSWLWGYEYMNPTDSRSRPGHAALNGKQVKKNSPEFSVIGRPPFSYQCRCAIAPLIQVEPGEFEQTATRTEGAQVERFSSEQPCWICI